MPADDADPGRGPQRRPRPASDADGDVATNERLLELLLAIKAGVDALHAGQQQLLAERTAR